MDNLPNSITHIEFSEYSEFNQPIDNLPNSLTHLKFNDIFDQPVDNLPDSLTHLTFGYGFDQLVDNLPESLTHLTFGEEFNQPVDNLPRSLTHLEFGEKFNQPLDNLPNPKKRQYEQDSQNGITHLTICEGFHKNLSVIPNSITHFKVNGSFYADSFNEPFNSYAHFYSNCGDLNITHFTVTDSFDFIPFDITHFRTERGMHPSDIKYLPDTIQEISMPKSYEKTMKDVIPKNIKVDFY